MKKSVLILAALLSVAACRDNVVYKDSSAPVERRVEDLLSRMTLQEKVLQLSQYFVGDNDNVNNFGVVENDLPAEMGSLIYMSTSPKLANEIQRRAVEETRLGIPVLMGYDVIHGFRTIFPVPLAQACSWNPELVSCAAEVSAAEAWNAGIRWTFAPMVDIARDPRWGRIMEGYGEDPYAASVFCRAAVRGFQGESLSDRGSVAACLKHYVGYGASEAGRDYTPTDISRQTLWDSYMPPFQTGVESGAASVMSAFNTLNGVPTSGNHYTLTEVLRDKWGFDGLVVSDWCSVEQLINQGMAADRAEAAEIAINAGVDLDMCDWVYRDNLDSLVRCGAVSEDTVDEAVRRILRMKFRLGLFENPYTEVRPDEEIYLLPESREASLKTAEESIVLLKNAGGILPLDKQARVALVGPFADSASDMNGNWSAFGRGEDAVSIREGLSKDFPGLTSRAADADIVLCCIGQPASASGENCSYSTVDLPEDQQNLVKNLKKAGKKVIVLLVNGRPLALGGIEPYADAIVETWHLGTEAGNAVSAVLCGDVNPSGKLAATFPYSSGQIPIYYNRRQSGRRGTQGLYHDTTSDPLYAFGHGLSYSRFEYGPLQLSSTELSKDRGITATVRVTNASDVDGAETVMWFIQDVASRIARPVRELRHFEKAFIPAGESRDFTFEIDALRDLGTVNEDGDRYVNAGEFRLFVGDRTASIHLK